MKKKESLTKKQLVLQKVVEEGLPLELVSSSENIPERTIKKWVLDYTQTGQDLRLFQNEQAVTRFQALTIQQIEWIYHVILTKSPNTFELDGFLWNRYTFQKLIRHWCKKNYPTDSCYRLLSDLGFDFPTSDIRSINFNKNKDLESLKVDRYHFFQLNTYNLKKRFELLPGKSSQKGCFIKRVKETDTETEVIYAHSTQRKGVKFLLKSQPLDEPAIEDFVRKFSLDVPGKSCLILRQAKIKLSNRFLEDIENSYENIKLKVIAE